MSFNPPLLPTEIAPAFGGRCSNLTALFAGGQGVVFRGQLSNGGPAPIDVALKIYHPGQLHERTTREVDALKALRSEKLVELVESGKISLRGQDCVYVATRFIDGEALSNRLTRGAMTVAQVARVGTDVAAAIDLLWAKRIVHRDVKPPNIMISTTGDAILIDLGIARHLSLASLTPQGNTYGTLGYMSPEHARFVRALTCKSDVFALGIVLQECLLGRHPNNRQQAHLANGGLKTATLIAGAPAAFTTAIDAMVHPRPEHRPLPNVIAAQLQAFC